MLELYELNKRYAVNSVSDYPLSFKRGEGIYLYDFEDKKYIDMISGLAVVNFGYKHPRLIKALMDQANDLPVSTRLFQNKPCCQLLQRACELTNMDQGFPMITGVDAVETAIKTARKWGYVKKNIPEDKAEIIVCNNNFHGRTIAVISMSSNLKYQNNFGPLVNGFVHIPFDDERALELAINENTAAFIVEPIQGEGGVNIPKYDYLKNCAKICKKHDVMFIVDEIQTGIGRTGKLIESEGIETDGIILGKALGGGIVPMSLFLAKKHLMSVIEPGDHGSTFGGNPLCSYVAYEALNTLIDEGLADNSKKMGEYFINKLSKISSPLLKEVRGKGLFIAIEVNTHKISSRKLCEELMENGLLSIDTRSKCIRLVPPLIINKEQINESFLIIQSVISNLEKYHC